jgi:hypothetical protein
MRRAIVDGILSGLAAAIATAAARGVADVATRFAQSHAGELDADPDSAPSVAKRVAAGVATAALTGTVSQQIHSVSRSGGVARALHPGVSTAYVVIGLGWTIYKVMQRSKRRRELAADVERHDFLEPNHKSSSPPVVH